MRRSGANLNPLAAYAAVLNAPVEAQSRRDVARTQAGAHLQGIAMQQEGAGQRNLFNLQGRMGMKQADLDWQAQKHGNEMAQRWAELDEKAQHYRNMDRLGLMDSQTRQRNQQYLENKWAENLALDEAKFGLKTQEFGLKQAKLPYEVEDLRARTQKTLSDLGLNEYRAQELASRAVLNQARTAGIEEGDIPYKKAQAYNLIYGRTPLQQAEAERHGAESEFTRAKTVLYPGIEQSKANLREAQGGYYGARAKVLPYDVASQIDYRERMAKTAEVKAAAQTATAAVGLQGREQQFAIKQIMNTYGKQARMSVDLYRTYLQAMQQDPAGIGAAINDGAAKMKMTPDQFLRKHIIDPMVEDEMKDDMYYIENLLTPQAGIPMPKKAGNK